MNDSENTNDLLNQFNDDKSGVLDYSLFDSLNNTNEGIAKLEDEIKSLYKKARELENAIIESFGAEMSEVTYKDIKYSIKNDTKYSIAKSVLNDPEEEATRNFVVNVFDSLGELDKIKIVKEINSSTFNRVITSFIEETKKLDETNDIPISLEEIFKDYKINVNEYTYLKYKGKKTKSNKG
jgi:hypothetical protein